MTTKTKKKDFDELLDAMNKSLIDIESTTTAPTPKQIVRAVKRAAKQMCGKEGKKVLDEQRNVFERLYNQLPESYDWRVKRALQLMWEQLENEDLDTANKWYKAEEMIKKAHKQSLQRIREKIDNLPTLGRMSDTGYFNLVDKKQVDQILKEEGGEDE